MCCEVRALVWWGGVWGGGLRTRRWTRMDMEGGCARGLPGTWFGQGGMLWIVVDGGADKDWMMIGMVGG